MMDQHSLPSLPLDEWLDMAAKVQEARHVSKEQFVAHFKQKYSDPCLPLFMATETLSLGCIAKLYKGAHATIQSVARDFEVAPAVIESWLRSLNVVRNICAHHSRLWNREMGFKPMIPDKDPQWRDPVRVPNNRVFAILTISKYCLSRIAPQSHWDARLRELLGHFPMVPVADMGFPDNWEACPIWAFGSP
jgi:abortive infection bacteriophage resistance protein